MNANPVILTRVCVDDFDIFQIWAEYYQRRYTDLRCCLFKRPVDDIVDIARFCESRNITYQVLEGGIFDNGPTYAVMEELAANASVPVCMVVDCDEFISDFDTLDQLVTNMPADSVLLKMVDRVSYDIFYDISQCKTYEDLCAVAPLHSNITTNLQNWSDERCCLNKLPDLGVIHYPSLGKSSLLVRKVHLDHFKWRNAWLKKAERRLEEITSIGYTWQSGLRAVLDKLRDGKPKRYLTIPGFFDYENLYEEQCLMLQDGAVLVELGVWKGRSIAYLAECAKLMEKRFNIFGVDIFEGRMSDKVNWENCSVLDTKRNLEERGLAEFITLFKITSTEAALYFADKSVDFVWLDAGHGLESVMKDIAAWWPKIKTGGTIGGHDLPYFDVAEALQKMGVRYTQDRTSWIVRNMPEDRPAMIVPLP